MLIIPVPCLQDNYAYLLLDEKTKTAAVVDPVEPDNVLHALKKEYADYNLTMILTTHHHWDHAGGNSKLVSVHPGLAVYGGSSQVQAVTHIIDDSDNSIRLGSLAIKPYITRGHTMDHLCYHVADDEQGAIFTGDCLFSSGCGRFFEGTPSDMNKALTTLNHLPESTHVYFGHEYTVANCRFALTVEPDNLDLKEKAAWANNVTCTTPSTLLNERLTNPFLRVHELSVRHAVVKQGENVADLTDVEVLGRVRQMKDNA